MSALASLLPRHAFVDLETTGLDPLRDEVIEVGVVFVEHGQVTGQVSELFKARAPLSPVISQLTGLTDADLAGRIPFSAFIPHLTLKLDGWTVVAHNAQFEQSFLQPVLDVIQAPVLDTCELLHFLHPELPHHSLEALIQWTGIGVSSAHRAAQDARDTFDVLKVVLERCVDEGRLEDVSALLHSLSGEGGPQAPIELLSTLEKLCAQVRPPLTLTAPGHFLPAPAGTRRRQPHGPTSAPLADEVTRLLADDGPLAEVRPGLVVREADRSAATRVAQRFERGGALALETGSDPGPSLTWLAPAVRWSARGEGPVTIATQSNSRVVGLLEKELPTLHAATRGAFGFAALKAQTQYFCRRRTLEATRPDPALGWDERAPRAYLGALLRRNPVGTRDQVSWWFRQHYPATDVLIEQCVSHPQTTLGSACPHFHRCFFHSAVANAKAADVVVVDHALAARWPAEFPRLSRVVIDEAHALEDSATAAFTERIDEDGLISFFQRFTVRRGLAEWVRGAGDGELSAALQRLCHDLKVDVEIVGAALKGLLPPPIDAEWGVQLRLDAAVRTERSWLRVRDALHGLRTTLVAIEQSCDEGARRFRRGEEGLARELDLQRAQSTGWQAAIDALADRPDDTRCDVATLSHDHWSLELEPIEIASRLKPLLSAPAVVLAASALSSGARSWVPERLGFEAPLVRLPLHRRIQVVLVTDAPRPQSPEFVEWAAARISGLGRYLGGRTLGLFSSKTRLDPISRAVELSLKSAGVDVLKQGRGFARGLARRDDSAPGMVLLGSRPFWRGLEVPGPTLSCVFVDQLPFESTQRPLVAARELGLGPRAWRLPRALVQLRQAISRLARSDDDRCVLVVADPGAEADRAALLEALGDCDVLTLPWAQARVAIKHFYEQPGSPAEAH